MGTVFRARFVASLRKELPPQSTTFYETLFKHHWVVYCKRPFLGPAQVVEYLGRYTHKIAISNHRIKNLDNNGEGNPCYAYPIQSSSGVLPCTSFPKVLCASGIMGS